jgi:hypothetical protein
MSSGEPISSVPAFPMLSGAGCALSPEELQALPTRRKQALFETVTWENRGIAPTIELLLFVSEMTID